jgi:2-polyprenyl-3-methyl-5-hydroxy-6-metoxy-1,4-benzoquinol methylase
MLKALQYTLIRIKRLLATRGIHFFVIKYGPQKWRSIAFDEKYRLGHWCFKSGGAAELASVIQQYLRHGDLLIMGCGGAGVLESLEPRALNSVLGIDISQEAIRLASRFVSDNVSFQLADMVTYECLQPYDVILFSESLYYVPLADQKSLLTRLAVHLKTGGTFIATFAQAKRYWKMIEGIRKNFSVIEDHTFPGSDRHLIVFKSH